MVIIFTCFASKIGKRIWRNAPYRCPYLLASARKRRGEPVARPAENHSDRVTVLQTFKRAGYLHEILSRFVWHLDDTLRIQNGNVLVFLNRAPLAVMRTNAIRFFFFIKPNDFFALCKFAPRNGQPSHEKIELMRLGVQVIHLNFVRRANRNRCRPRFAFLGRLAAMPNANESLHANISSNWKKTGANTDDLSFLYETCHRPCPLAQQPRKFRNELGQQGTI